MTKTADTYSKDSSEVLVLFDFDGTLTSRDSFADFLLFSRGYCFFIIGAILLLPVLIGYKCRLISNQTAKEKVLKFFFKGWPKKEFKKNAIHYAQERLPKLLKAEAVDRLKWHLKRKHTVFIVSASLEEYLEPWAEPYKIPVIGSQLEYINEKVTGNLEGKNCHGAEKVHRIKQHIDLKNYREIYAYGDSRGDREMLLLADHGFYKRYF